MGPDENPPEDSKEKKAQEYEKFLSERAVHLKPEINSLLFAWLPGQTTLDEMDMIAVRLYEEIMAMWRNKNL